MTLSSSSAQTREIGELRNQLKWMDEERRKSGRKLTELEQRLAQQGRELSERDRKIQELEWHIANVAERLERVPEEDPKIAAQEQRLQDLEWHLSNLSAQLAGRPNLEEERARLNEEVNRSIQNVQEQIQAEQTAAEGRLRAAEERLLLQFQALEETLSSQIRVDEQLAPVVGRQQEQDQTLVQLNEQLAGVQESVDMLSTQLRERTVTLAAESQTNFAALANRVQEYLDAQAEQFDTRTAMIEADWQQRLDIVANRTPEVAPEYIQLSAQTESLREYAEMLRAHMDSLNERMEAFHQQSVELDGRVVALAERPQADLAPQVAGLEQLVATLQDQVATSHDIITGVGERLAGFQEDSAAVAGRLGQLDDAIVHLQESVAKLGNARELMTLFDRMEQELELRQAEEVRLANLISAQEGRFVPLNTALEESRETIVKLLSRMSEMERTVEETRRSAQDFNDNWKPILTEVSRRLGPLTERITVLNNGFLKAEAGLQALNGDQSELRETLATLADETHRTRAESTRQLEAWQVTIDEHKDTIERFTQQWLTLSNQYKEARMAVQNFAHWQKQLEQQKREASEMLRIESNRMQSRWDGFLLEIQEKLKNFELDLSQKWQAFELENEQRWAGARRSEQVWREELGAVDDLIQKLQQDNRTLIWRVQAAQADAIKKWPRLLMEEVEKAVELNPNRRLAPSTATPRNDMSVVDAIEQGLITIDYADDASGDL